MKIHTSTGAEKGATGAQQAPPTSSSLYNTAETVLEKPDTVSNVGTMYKNFLTVPLAEVLFSNPDDGQRF